MSVKDLKSELSKLDRGALLDVLQHGLEVIRNMEADDFETPAWLKEELLSRAASIKSNEVPTYTWDEVKQYAKSSNA
ncbi:MAG: addiction module protein [Bacteroidota bacterium]